MRPCMQMVWVATTSIGCGSSICNAAGARLMVCRYNPTGNVAGAYRDNVLSKV